MQVPVLQYGAQGMIGHSSSQHLIGWNNTTSSRRWSHASAMASRSSSGSLSSNPSNPDPRTHSCPAMAPILLRHNIKKMQATEAANTYDCMAREAKELMLFLNVSSEVIMKVKSLAVWPVGSDLRSSSQKNNDLSYRCVARQRR
jgi:hypothetical protein